MSVGDDAPVFTVTARGDRMRVAVTRGGARVGEWSMQMYPRLCGVIQGKPFRTVRELLGCAEELRDRDAFLEFERFANAFRRNITRRNERARRGWCDHLSPPHRPRRAGSPLAAPACAPPADDADDSPPPRPAQYARVGVEQSCHVLACATVECIETRAREDHLPLLEVACTALAKAIADCLDAWDGGTASVVQMLAAWYGTYLHGRHDTLVDLLRAAQRRLQCASAGAADARGDHAPGGVAEAAAAYLSTRRAQYGLEHGAPEKKMDLRTWRAYARVLREHFEMKCGHSHVHVVQQSRPDARPVTVACAFSRPTAETSVAAAALGAVRYVDTLMVCPILASTFGGVGQLLLRHICGLGMPVAVESREAPYNWVHFLRRASRQLPLKVVYTRGEEHRPPPTVGERIEELCGDEGLAAYAWAKGLSRDPCMCVGSAAVPLYKYLQSLEDVSSSGLREAVSRFQFALAQRLRRVQPVHRAAQSAAE